MTDKINPTPRWAMFQRVDRERLAQEQKFGDQRGNLLGTWLTILGEEYGELAAEVEPLTPASPILTRLLAALGARFGELCNVSLFDSGASPAGRPIGSLTANEARTVLVECVQTCAVAVSIGELLIETLRRHGEPDAAWCRYCREQLSELADFCSRPCETALAASGKPPYAWPPGQARTWATVRAAHPRRSRCCLCSAFTDTGAMFCGDHCRVEHFDTRPHRYGFDMPPCICGNNLPLPPHPEHSRYGTANERGHYCSPDCPRLGGPSVRRPVDNPPPEEPEPTDAPDPAREVALDTFCLADCGTPVSSRVAFCETACAIAYLAIRGLRPDRVRKERWHDCRHCGDAVLPLAGAHFCTSSCMHESYRLRAEPVPS